MGSLGCWSSPQINLFPVSTLAPTGYLLKIEQKFTLEENPIFNFYSRGFSSITLLRYFDCRGARSITSTSTSTVLFTAQQQDKAKGKRKKLCYNVNQAGKFSTNI